MEALITKYWPIVLSIFAAVVWAVRVEAGTIGNRRENRRLQKQRDEDVHRQERQRDEDLEAASDQPPKDVSEDPANDPAGHKDDTGKHKMTSKTVRKIALEIVRREGGFVDDPDDPGGATKHGVTIHTMRRLGLDLDGDGDVDVGDVKALTLDQAVDIFLRHYFEKPGIARLSEPLQATVFDMQVNAGSNAVKHFAAASGGASATIVSVDGQIGPQTARITQAAFTKAPDHLVDAYGIARRNYYYALGDRRPASRKYARRRNGGKGGWITRAEEFISPKYHLTEAQHRARISTWV